MKNYHSRQDLVLKPGTGEIIRNILVAIIGVGSIGNAILGILVRMGFRRFFLVDFDHVEESNLSKSQCFCKGDVGKPKAQVAAEYARQNILHDHPEVEFINGNLMQDVGKGIFWDCDIIISAVDTMNCRAYINDWCVRAGKPFIEVGMTDFQVNVSFFAPDCESKTYPVCLRDQIGEGDYEGKRNSCSGLKIQDTELKVIPTIECTAAIAGAIVAKELVLYLEGRSTIVGKTLFFFGLNNETFDMIITPNPNLKIREEAFMPVTTVKTVVNPTVGQLLKAVEKALGHAVVIRLPETFVFTGHCNDCGKLITYNRRRSQIWNHERWCEECRKREDYQSRLYHNDEWVTLQEVSTVSAPEILRSKLRDIGIPKDDVLEATVCVNGDFETYHVRLDESEPKCKISGPCKVEPFSLKNDPADYYMGCEGVEEDVKTLAKVKEIFADPAFQPQAKDEGCTCYLNKNALDAFKEYALGVYNQRGHEATGVIVGYYCSDPANPDHQFTVGTHFIPASGGTTHVTCEISLSDGIRISDYCTAHKVFPVCWIHSHPGFGAFFSGTDRATLKAQYNAVYQTGVVMDILKDQSMAYKCVDGVIKESTYYVVDDEANPPVLLTKRMKPVPKIKEKYNKHVISLLNGSIVINI